MMSGRARRSYPDSTLPGGGSRDRCTKTDDRTKTARDVTPGDDRRRERRRHRERIERAGAPSGACHAEPPCGDAIVSVVPTCLLDTREGLGAPAAKVGQGGIVELTVTGGTNGVPADAAAAVINVTVTNPTPPASSPSGPAADERPPPPTSTSCRPDDPQPRHRQARRQRQGLPALNRRHRPRRRPDRLLPRRRPSRRSPTGARHPRRARRAVPPIGAAPRRTTVTGGRGVPADGVPPSSQRHRHRTHRAGYVTVWPCGTRRPNASNLNVVPAGRSPTSSSPRSAPTARSASSPRTAPPRRRRHRLVPRRRP